MPAYSISLYYHLDAARLGLTIGRKRNTRDKFLAKVFQIPSALARPPWRPKPKSQSLTSQSERSRGRVMSKASDIYLAHITIAAALLLSLPYPTAWERSRGFQLPRDPCPCHAPPASPC